jgi:hypothetical protein
MPPSSFRQTRSGSGPRSRQKPEARTGSLPRRRRHDWSSDERLWAQTYTCIVAAKHGIVIRIDCAINISRLTALCKLAGSSRSFTISLNRAQRSRGQSRKTEYWLPWKTSQQSRVTRSPKRVRTRARIRSVTTSPTPGFCLRPEGRVLKTGTPGRRHPPTMLRCGAVR